jgi:cyclohexadieny/prephenate dehydrogenase
MLHFKRISVVGAGLIGGSILLAAKKRNIAEGFSCWSHSPSTLTFWSNLGWVDVCTSLKDSVKDADLVIIATPVDKIGETFVTIAPFLKPGCLISDVGSIKGEVFKAASVLPPSVNFIGSHPMAGSEKAGAKNAHADLFENRFCFITPGPRDPSESVQKIEQFWQSLGSKTFLCSTEKHDEIVAAISHTPHASAAALILAVKNLPGFKQAAVGAGLKDSTRIAAGEENLWVGILLANATHVAQGLKEVEKQTAALRTVIERGDAAALSKILEAARIARQSLDQTHE